MSSDDESAQPQKRTFRCLSQLEHVLHRPDMYLGSTTVQPVSALAFYQEDGKVRSELVTATLNPALLKLLDEAIVNALDNQEKCDNQKSIRLDVDDAGKITVSNDGDTIPIEKYSDTDDWLPTCVFSRFLTGSNFDDSEDKFTGGKFGIGIKATNAWSTLFRYTVVNARDKKRFEQTCRDNMSVVEAPVLKAVALKRSCTTVEFVPDYARLGMPWVLERGLDPALRRILESRAFEACACTRADVHVHLNGAKLACKSAATLVQAMGGCGAVAKDAVETEHGIVWQAFVAPVGGDDHGRTVAFVNGIACHAGAHVDYAHRKIKEIVLAKIKRKDDVRIAE